MKRFLFFIFSAFVLTSHAQTLNCGFNEAYERLFKADHSARSRFETAILPDPVHRGVNSTSLTSFTIPVVFHVLHMGGGENISDAQILNAVQILNRDFRKLNPDTTSIVTEFKNLAADCEINFVLASKDPDGKCTNGITRHYDTKTNWNANMPADYTYTWPPSKYLNIYVVRSMQNGAAGYTYLPGTVPTAMDAIVILNNFIGNTGTSNNSNSRALTHEVGHWFNLQHVWGSNNNPGVACGDDAVGDTPNTKGHTWCNLLNAIDCTPGVKENIQNYMEYAYCSRMYTIGQKTRMHNCLNSATAERNNLSSNSNLIATGVINPLTDCAPKAEYLVGTSITCVGNSLTFTDQSYNAPATTWTWSSPLAAQVSTLQNGILVFTGSGLTSVKLKAGNNFGSDSVVKNVVTVLSASTTSGSISMSEGFESGNFPSNDWIATTPQYGSPFALTSSVAATGSNCVWVNNYIDNPNGPVSFYTSAFNLQNTIIAQLSFKLAYAQQNAGNNDKLNVYISKNCGFNWINIYSSAGALLNTTGSLFEGPFNPSSSQWRTENIDLLLFSGSDRVYFKFEFTPDPTGAGNNFFIDDINLNAVVGLEEQSTILQGVHVFPNPFNNELIIETDNSEEPVSIKINDITGRELVSLNDLKSVSGKIILKELNLSKGIYFLNLNRDNKTKTIKLICD